MSALWLSGASDEATGSKARKLEVSVPSEQPPVIASRGAVTDAIKTRSLVLVAESLHVSATGVFHSQFEGEFDDKEGPPVIEHVHVAWGGRAIA